METIKSRFETFRKRINSRDTAFGRLFDLILLGIIDLIALLPMYLSFFFGRSKYYNCRSSPEIDEIIQDFKTSAIFQPIRSPKRSPDCK